jgi:hypothetical protein
VTFDVDGLGVAVLEFINGRYLDQTTHVYSLSMKSLKLRAA